MQTEVHPGDIGYSLTFLDQGEGIAALCSRSVQSHHVTGEHRPYYTHHRAPQYLIYNTEMLARLVNNELRLPLQR